MRLPSARSAGVAVVGLSLGTAAAAGLHAPEWVWVVTAIGAGACVLAAPVLYILEGRSPAKAKRGGHSRIIPPLPMAARTTESGHATPPRPGIQELRRLAAERALAKSAHERRVAVHREEQRFQAHLWLNQQRDQGNQLLGRWPLRKLQDYDLRREAREWENATYEGLVQRFPAQQAHFRVEVGFGPEMNPQNRGVGSWESAERAMLRRRLQRLSEIAEWSGRETTR